MDELAREQDHLDLLFLRRDELLKGATEELDAASAAEDPAVAEAADRRVRSLGAAERKLCFGRLDLVDGSRHYIGRVGLSAPEDDQDPLLIDWRAPVASAFYTATSRAPGPVTRRRHLQTDGRVVAGISDEVLTDAGDSEVVGEAALLAALSSRRTGHMQDVVATIQAEQDAIIRATHTTPIVVQGGPGTGKTAVALHRAAYLLFRQPHLAERGVLVIGPSRAFLDYIDQVLPALGETQVVTSSIDDLLPEAEVTETDEPAVAVLKSDLGWSARLRALVAGRRRLEHAVTTTVAGDEITVTPGDLERMSARALSTHSAHNAAREIFAELLRDLLVQRTSALRTQGLADVERGFEDVLGKVDKAIDRDLSGYAVRGTSGTEVDGSMSPAERQSLRRSLDDDPAVQTLVDRLWPRLEPAVMLRELLVDPKRFDPELPVVLRTSRSGWSSADIALLDELAELIGGDAPPVIESGTLAERALADRTWTYGHGVIDEAQELSPMQWRMVLRRCPSKSLTIVGDIDQTSAPAGACDWDAALGMHLESRWQLKELTINYRTPRQVMELAEEVRGRVGSSVMPARALRDGVSPRQVSARAADLGRSVADEVSRLATAYDGGSVAVIAPPHRLDELAGVTAEAMAITPETAKGLEFDAVVVVDPAAIEEAPRGASGLYVAMTRCTQELVLVHRAAS